MPAPKWGIHLGQVDNFGDGTIMMDGKHVPNCQVAINSANALSAVLKNIERNGGVPEVKMSGFYLYPSSIDPNSIPTIQNGIKNFSKQVENMLKKAGAKKVDIDIRVQSDDFRTGLVSTTIEY